MGRTTPLKLYKATITNSEGVIIERYFTSLNGGKKALEKTYNKGQPLPWKFHGNNPYVDKCHSFEQLGYNIYIEPLKVE